MVRREDGERDRGILDGGWKNRAKEEGVRGGGQQWEEWRRKSMACFVLFLSRGQREEADTC